MVEPKLQVVLERRDCARNVARFYVLAIEPSLYGDAALMRAWGRIGSLGRQRLDLYASAAEAGEALEAWLAHSNGRGQGRGRRRHRGRLSCAGKHNLHEEEAEGSSRGRTRSDQLLTHCKRDGVGKAAIRLRPHAGRSEITDSFSKAAISEGRSVRS